MKKNEKILIGVLVAAVIIVILIGVMISKKKNENTDVPVNSGVKTEMPKEDDVANLEDGSKINTSEKFNSVKRYNTLEISNIQFTEKNGMSVLLADVTNKGTTKHEIEIVKITILDKDGKAITEIKPIIGAVEPGKTIKLNASITADVVNAKDFKIEAVK